ncbi:DUF4153 domain-containing protein [Methyloligella solikamskensis]|uniref:DUF4153 domain-containing protein n=1 Tax=Methyloligella solikamskensis TaxID=1177756 RepID=A0ABW3J7Y0_9HYPH
MAELFRKIRWREAAANIAQDAVAGIVRFPIPVALCVAMFLLARSDLEAGMYFRLFAIWVCGSLLFISLQLNRERQGWGALTVYVLGPVLFVAVAAIFLASWLPSIPYDFLASGLFLLGFAAPYLRKEQQGTAFWTYAAKLALNGVLSAIGATILFLGGCAIIYSIKYLFGVDLNAIRVVKFIGEASLYLVFPIAVLAGIPSDFNQTADRYPKSLRLIADYAVIPLLAIYTVILYAYMAKIALAGELPEGGVAYLVVGYAVAGVLTYLLVYPLESGLAALFRRVFFPLLILPLILLAIAIGVRIEEYGLTEHRYALLLCLVWLTISVGLAVLLDRMRAPALIVWTLALLLIGASAGPWSAVGISTWSQVGRLEAVLKHSGVLVNGKMTQPSKEPSRADRVAVSGIVDYLAGTNKLHEIGPWIGDPEHPGLPPESFDMTAKTAVERMGFDYVQAYERVTDAPRRFSFGTDRGAIVQKVTEVAGYDYLIALSLSPDEKRAQSLEERFALKAGEAETDELVAKYDPDALSMEIAVPSKKERVRFDLAPLIERFADTARSIQPDELTMEESDGPLRVRLELRRIHGSVSPEGDRPKIKYFYGKLLIALE